MGPCVCALDAAARGCASRAEPDARRRVRSGHRVLLQDNQHCCDDNHLASLVGLNSMVMNVTTFCRSKMSQRGFSNVVHRNAKTAARAPLITYKRVFSVFALHPLLAMQYLCEYFSTSPVEE